MVDVILVELTQDHRLEVTPLAQRLADVVSLLPPVQAVLGRVVPLLTLRGPCRMPGPGPEPIREIFQNAGNVIVESTTREPRARRELPVSPNRFSPELQQMLPPLSKVGR